MKSVLKFKVGDKVSVKQKAALIYYKPFFPSGSVEGLYEIVRVDKNCPTGLVYQLENWAWFREEHLETKFPTFRVSASFEGAVLKVVRTNLSKPKTWVTVCGNNSIPLSGFVIKNPKDKDDWVKAVFLAVEDLVANDKGRTLDKEMRGKLFSRVKEVIDSVKSSVA